MGKKQHKSSDGVAILMPLDRHAIWSSFDTLDTRLHPYPSIAVTVLHRSHDKDVGVELVVRAADGMVVNIGQWSFDKLLTLCVTEVLTNI